MLPRRRDISSVTKPSSGALRRWASGSTEFCAVALAKWPHGICPYPAVRPMCPKPPAPPTCPMRLRARGWSPYRLCLDPSRRGCRRDRLAARRLIPRYLAVLKSPPRFSAPVSVSQQSGSRIHLPAFHQSGMPLASKQDRGTSGKPRTQADLSRTWIKG